MSEQMEDRVHARLIADGLDFGLSPTEAIDWADSQMDSTQAAGIRMSLALRDLTDELGESAHEAMSGARRCMNLIRQAFRS